MTVRWEARSHTQIYQEVHTATGDLAGTVAGWRLSAADLCELRSRYESALGRLMAVSEGASADAAARASRKVTRGLAEAQELAAHAGAQRARLVDLNEELRRTLPPPVPPTEATSNFTCEGTAWLTPPNFPADDARRLNEEEIARDRMRAYELAIGPDTLTGDPTPAHADHANPTVPLIPKPQFPPAYTPPPPDDPPAPAPPPTWPPTTGAAGTAPAFEAVPLHTPPDGGGFAPVPPRSLGTAWVVGGQLDPPPTVPFAALEFGPTGHVEPEGEPAPAAPVLGPPPQVREWADSQTYFRHTQDSPFQPGFQVSPAVLGES